MLPWSFVGVGVLVAWLCCTHLPDIYMYATSDAATKMVVDYGMRAGDIGAFFLVAVLWRKIGPISSHPRLCAVLVALCAACTYAATLFGASLSFGSACVLAMLSVAAGIGGAALFLLWAEAYVQLGNTRCLLFGAVGCIAAGAFSLVVSQMNPPAGNAAIALLPIISGAMVAVSLSRLPGEGASRRTSEGACQADCAVASSQQDADSDVAAVPSAQRAVSNQGGRVPPAGRGVTYPVPWKLLLLMALAGFASGFAGSILSPVDGIGAVHRIAATVISGVALLVAFVVRKGEVDVRLFAWVTLPLAIVFFAMIPLVGETAGELISFLVKLAYVAFALFTLFMLANVCYRRGIPSARVFASARAASEGAMLAGILLRRWMRDAGILDSSEMLWVVCLIGLVATVGCVLLWHTERSVTSDWGVVGVDAASGFQVKSERDLLLERVELLAQEKGLTPREREVLALLAQGHDAPAIEGELFLSHNTLKTHLRHIYAKLGVHTRAEALEMLGR